MAGGGHDVNALSFWFLGVTSGCEGKAASWGETWPSDVGGRIVRHSLHAPHSREHEEARGPASDKDMPDGGCGAHEGAATVPVLGQLRSFACIGLVWGLPGWLRVFDNSLGAGLSTTFLLRL
jgi:hypothetical protein